MLYKGSLWFKPLKTITAVTRSPQSPVSTSAQPLYSEELSFLPTLLHLSGLLPSKPDHVGQGHSGFSSAEEEEAEKGGGDRNRTTLGHPPSLCIDFSFPITEHLILSFLSTSGVHHTRQNHTLRKLTVTTGEQRGAHARSNADRRGGPREAERFLCSDHEIQRLQQSPV